MGFVSEFIKSAASNSQLLAHQLIWNMKTNMYRDDDSQIQDSEQINFQNYRCKIKIVT